MLAGIPPEGCDNNTISKPSKYSLAYAGLYWPLICPIPNACWDTTRRMYTPQWLFQQPVIGPFFIFSNTLLKGDESLGAI